MQNSFSLITLSSVHRLWNMTSRLVNKCGCCSVFAQSHDWRLNIIINVRHTKWNYTSIQQVNLTMGGWNAQMVSFQNNIFVCAVIQRSLQINSSDCWVIYITSTEVTNNLEMHELHQRWIHSKLMIFYMRQPMGNRILITPASTTENVEYQWASSQIDCTVFKKRRLQLLVFFI